MENVSDQLDKNLNNNSYCRCSFYREFYHESWCQLGYGRGECDREFASLFYKKSKSEINQ